MSDIIGHGGGKSGDSQHTHFEATDSLLSISYARVLDLISGGEIEGLADGMKSIFLDETPLQNADGTMNYKDATVDFRSVTHRLRRSDQCAQTERGRLQFPVQQSSQRGADFGTAHGR